MYIINGYECDCVFYANENHVRVCYNNEEEWFNSTNHYKYKYKNQCLLGNETDCKFKVEGEGSNNYLQKAFFQKKNIQTIIIIILTKIFAGLHAQLESLPML